jgi:hypothetical protein
VSELENTVERSAADVAAGAKGDIGWAVREMRYHGGRVRRACWRDGSCSFVVFQKGYPDGIPINANTAQATGLAQGTVCAFLPYLMAFNATMGAFHPFVCGNDDVLANDWELVR